MTLDPSARQCDASDPHCITCGDEGVSMQVRSADQTLALCLDDSGAEHAVAIDLVAPVTPGDRLLVHAGVAIAQMEQGS